MDVLQAAVWDLAVAGDTDAIKLALAVHDGRVKLLGLAAPVALDVQVRKPRTPAEVLADYERIELPMFTRHPAREAVER